jgi:hypothetical protein
MIGTTSCGPACTASSASTLAVVAWHVGGHRHQVADLAQEGLVGGHVGDRAGVGAVPGVHLGLDAVALGQQGGVLRRQVGLTIWSKPAQKAAEAMPVPGSTWSSMKR